ncbi:MAG: hypothetical protein SCH98_04390 [Deferrisomatales bacterium]|nr:hypothetical protein [Deferrisomatales bacterium]
MQAYRVETTVAKGGRIVLDRVPFVEGEPVEVIVIERPPLAHEAEERYPLRGKPYRYDDPTEPVALEDWEALK